MRVFPHSFIDLAHHSAIIYFVTFLFANIYVRFTFTTHSIADTTIICTLEIDTGPGPARVLSGPGQGFGVRALTPGPDLGQLLNPEPRP